MSALFTPRRIGKIEIKNRFVHSATYECMASDHGEVTNKLIKRYAQIAKGGAGLIIPGYLYVSPNGQCTKYQTAIHTDDMIKGLQNLVDAVHDQGSKIAFQLVHAGRQTTKDIIGQTPLGPSEGPRDKIYMVKPKEMTEGEIRKTIKAFGDAALRASETGADGVQILAAHGYLVNQFLSQFFNKRKDSWGGSNENQFRFLQEILLETKKNVTEDMFVLVELNTLDYTPREGITLEMSKKYAERLAELAIDGLELSCGTLNYSMFNIMRGEVPIKELIMYFPWWRKVLGKMMLRKIEGKFDLEEGYHLDAAKLIKPVIGDIPLLAVGGLRKLSHMEKNSE